MIVHRIRLHGPWQVRPHRPDVPPRRMTIPGTLRDGGLAHYAGRVSLHRQFGRPTNLHSNDCVWLVFEEVVGLADIRVNGHGCVWHDMPIQFDVTGLLDLRNEIEVILDATDDSCGILKGVTLEIRSNDV